MSESLTDKLTRHGMAAASSHIYGGEAELLFAARDRITDLEAKVETLTTLLLNVVEGDELSSPDGALQSALNEARRYFSK